MALIPYKQSISNGCLVGCFFMLLGKGTNADEEHILIHGGRRKYPFYVVGIPKEVQKKYGTEISVVVDNKFFTRVLQNNFNDEQFSVTHHKITTKLIRELVKTAPAICHIDYHELGEFSHQSHFIVVEKATSKKFLIIDPWYGKKRWIDEKTLENAIDSLKNHIKMCPLLFYISHK